MQGKPGSSCVRKSVSPFDYHLRLSSNMRLSLVSAIGLNLSLSIATCLAARDSTVYRECPYASKLARNGQSAPQPDLIGRSAAPEDKLGVMYMNRIAPSGSQLWIANSDGTNSTMLMGNQSAPFDYHASWSRDGEWIVFTSERRADGQSDVYRVKPDGTDIETLVSTDSFEDAGSLSPDGRHLVYVSTAINYTANIFVKDLQSGISTNITGSDESVGSLVSPHSFFRPSWSPDDGWIAFSSDRNTDWTGHSNGTGWEHTQTLSLYLARPNGSDFRKVIGGSGVSLGTPRWSSDSKRLVYYNITTEDTYGAHGTSGQQSAVVSQIFSVDVATGKDVQQHTFDQSLKVAGSYIGNTSNVGYQIKAGPNVGINFTQPDIAHQYINATLRNPAFSPDGSKVVYEVYEWEQRQAGKELFSWDSQWDYRFMDVFPQFNNVTGRLASTQKQLGNASSSVVITDAEYSDLTVAFDVHNIDDSDEEASLYASGLAGAFQPTWNADGSKLAVGFGSWFAQRSESPGTLYLFDANGSTYRNLTDGVLNAGYPSFSPDGKKLVYRLWDQEKGPLGLHVMDIASGDTIQITNGWDNTPGWSPDGKSIVFTRQTDWTPESGSSWLADRFDICTINPDGTGLAVLTDSDANDAHAVWSYDGRILYNSGMFGFRDESPLYDDTFQPYGQIVVMNADGSNKTMLTDSMWEDSMPLYIPSAYFE